jgi:hypothetical protein
MNKDDIIEMAKEAGCFEKYQVFYFAWPDLERFANLIAQQEREACAYRARIALLGVDRDLAIRVDKIIGVRYGAK